MNENSVLYLVFEFLTMDLKKYLDSMIPKDHFMDTVLLKVSGLIIDGPVIQIYSAAPFFKILDARAVNS